MTAALIAAATPVLAQAGADSGSERTVTEKGLPSATARPAGPAKEEARLAHAGTLYRRNCASCHGGDGKGARARASLGECPDFTSHPWQRRVDDTRLTVSIREGRGDYMPAFSDRLNETQVEDLVTYIRTFGPRQRRDANPTRGDFEKQLRELEKRQQKLRRQFEELSAPPRKP
jgi:mono/diheme cytochrome c family protein